MFQMRLIVLVFSLICVFHEGTAFSKSDCELPVQIPGPDGDICLAEIPVFTWSNLEKKCVPDSFGGCHETNNMFRAEEDCDKIAKPICLQ
ncbi:PI-actitoxin-Axm2a-like [Leptinotarsa decemlineata]|uniref:PI-actitoxin-Axm2a-like n=1 Tax=Leptinotarsa decemlineata TaxID=7539 RepID=UPI003D307E1B